VLATLALNAGRTVAVETLTEAIWSGSPPSSARNQIQTCVSQLRRQLAAAGLPQVIDTVAAGYRLESDRVEVDAHRFRAQVAQARAAAADGRADDAREAYRAAVGLWRGPVLPGVESNLVRELAGGLDAERVQALEECLEVELTLGGAGELVAELTELVRRYPYRERLHAALMRALYRAGRTAEALAAFRHARQLFHDELGTEPGEELQRLHQAILNRDADPGLARRPPAGRRPVQELPVEVSGFVGRAPEMVWVRAALAPGRPGRRRPPVVVLFGPGGTGKSALAVRVAHELASEFPDGQLYVDLCGSTPGMRPLPPVEVLGRFLRRLGVHPSEVPSGEAEAAALFRSVAASRRLLLLLDNAADRDQVAGLIPGTAGCAVLVTSRHPLSTLDADERRRVEALPDSDGLALLAGLTGRLAAEPVAARQIVALCGGLPLAIRIAAGRLAGRPDLTGAEYARRLADRSRRLDELQLDDLAVRASIRTSYDALLGDDDPAGRLAARAFRMLGLLHVPDVAPPVVAAMLAQSEVDRARAALDRLVDAQLVEPVAGGRYRLHDLVRLVAAERAAEEETGIDREQSLFRAIAFTRVALATELGVSPGPERETLHTAVLNRSANLDELPSRVAGEARFAATSDGETNSEGPGGFQVAVPRSLPQDVPHLVGREKHLVLVRDHLTQPGTAPSIVAVHGRAGVGKSALCIHLGHQLQRAFPHGQLYANLHGMHPDSRADPHDMLGRFLRLLGVDGAALPTTLDERAELYRHLLAERAILVVLDDAASDDQVEPLLPGGHRCGVLVTSRPRVGASLHAHTIELDTLGPVSAINLLTGLIGTGRTSAEPHAVAELAALCGHLPLALQIAGARLAVKPHWRVTRLVNQMRNERSRLDSLRHAHLDVRASLTLSYRALHPDTRRLLRHLGDLNLPHASTWASAALLDTTIAQAEERLEELVDAQLTTPAGADPVGHTRYRMHDLVRLFATEHAAQDEPVESLAAARERAYGGCLHLARTAYHRICGGDYLIVVDDAPIWQCEPEHATALVDEPMRWFDTELSTVAVLVSRAATDCRTTVCWQLAATVSTMFQMGRHFDEWANVLRMALDGTPADKDPRGHAMLLHRMGWLSTDRTQYTEARRHFTEAARLFSRAGDSHGQALAETYLGMIERFSGNHDTALHHYQSALPALRDAADQGATGFTLRSIGQLHLTMGAHQLADHYLKDALETYTIAGSPQGRAQTICWQGMLALELHQPAIAAVRFHEALDLARTLGDLPGEAFCLHGLGLAHQQQGHKRQARHALAEALRIVTQPNPTYMERRIREALASL
jgi:DNA-binding SARP family transcriptional activator